MIFFVRSVVHMVLALNGIKTAIALSTDIAAKQYLDASPHP
jgi:hypothetical protein